MCVMRKSERDVIYASNVVPHNLRDLKNQDRCMKDPTAFTRTKKKPQPQANCFLEGFAKSRLLCYWKSLHARPQDGALMCTWLRNIKICCVYGIQVRRMIMETGVFWMFLSNTNERNISYSYFYVYLK